MADFEERTERATPRRRQKAREKGQVPRSRELVSIAGLFGTLLVFYFGGSQLMGRLTLLTAKLLDLQYGREPFGAIQPVAAEVFVIVFPFLLASAAFAFFSGVAQGGMIFVPLRLQPERLNPVQGFNRIFSLPGLAEFVKSLLKFVIGTFLFFFLLKHAVSLLPGLPLLGLAEMQTVSTQLLTKMVFYAFLTFLAIALGDYALERWRFERSIRMTRQEMREDQKETEGDPLIKSRIRSLQREMAQRRMMQEVSLRREMAERRMTQDVSKATVVITDPTHIAVALKYDTAEMSAPTVVAKGKGFVAERIRGIAEDHRIPIVEDRPVARALFKLDLGAAIPQELFRAVAKILAYVCRARGAA
ncbi:MAG: EscU/YscU/HrcU family type III secretion system export apparatus switch protein [Chloroflexota bacterium]